MQSDVENGDQGQTAGGADAGGCEANGLPMWKLGSQIATRNVNAARKAYLRYAETAERALSHVDSTTSRMGEDLWAMASVAHDALLGPRGNGSGSAQARDLGGRADALQARVARGRAELRDVALQGQVAADTNVRAYLDHLDDLATAPSARKLMSAQTSYVWDQWQRSLQQAFDLQRRTVDAMRKITSAPTA